MSAWEWDGTRHPLASPEPVDADRWRWQPCVRCGQWIDTKGHDPNWYGVGHPMDDAIVHIKCPPAAGPIEEP